MINDKPVLCPSIDLSLQDAAGGVRAITAMYTMQTVHHLPI